MTSWISSSEIPKQFDSFSSVEVCDYLRRHASLLDNSVFEKMTEHKIDGEVFCLLTKNILGKLPLYLVTA